MSLKLLDPDQYASCRKCEDYLGSLVAMRAVLDQEGDARGGIALNISSTSVNIVSATRLRQYLYERTAEIEAEEKKRENRWRLIETGVIVLATALLTTSGNLFVQYLAGGLGGS